jgi:hypothetical protein
MGVIGFVYVALGSSTVHLHDSVGNRSARACSETGFSSKSGTVIEECITEEQNYLLRFFLWAKGLNAKDIHKKMFPVCGGKCLSRKAFHNWVANVSLMTKKLKRRCGSGWDNRHRLLCCGFRRLVKAMGQVYQCWWRICWEITFFLSSFEYHIF